MLLVVGAAGLLVLVVVSAGGAIGQLADKRRRVLLGRLLRRRRRLALGAPLEEVVVGVLGLLRHLEAPRPPPAAPLLSFRPTAHLHLARAVPVTTHPG